jgi:cysteine desulfurase
MTSNNDQSYIYLDNAASTPIYKEVIDEMLPFMFENYGNPSSLHKFGRKARQGLLNSRLKIANSIGANLHEILFTSGGTESNNLALTGTSNASLYVRKLW